MIASDPNVYVWLLVLTAFFLTGGMLITLTVDTINPSTDCVLEEPSVLSTLNEEEDEADEDTNEDEDEEDEDDEDTDTDTDTDTDEKIPEVDTDEEDRIVGKKVNRLLAKTLDTLIEVRKAREERAAKRLKVE